MHRKFVNGRLNFKFAAAGLSVLLISACATTSFLDRRVEQTIRTELSRHVGPADRYDVDVSGARFSGEIGDLERVHVVGARVKRAKAPVIDRLEIDLSNVVIDRKEKRLKSVAAADAQARILAIDIVEFLEAKPGLDGVTVTLDPPDEIVVSGRPSMAGYTLPKAVTLKVRGRLVAEGKELKLEVSDLRAAGFSVGAIPKLLLEKAINPLIDLSPLPVSWQISSVTVNEDAMVVEATGGSTLWARR